MMKYLFLPFLALCLVQCNTSTKSDSNDQEVLAETESSNGTIYMCQCHEGNDQQSDSLRMTKKVYVYLVQSEQTPDCCTNTLVEGYDAYVENWINNRPGSPKIVWSTNDQSTDTIAATEAMSLACAMEEKTFGIHSIENLSPSFKKYYPELTKTK